MKRIRVLLADDDLDMLSTVYELLHADFDIVDMVSDGPSLVDAAFRLEPDVIVSDISMPKLSGFKAIRKIRDCLPRIKVIFLTMHGTPAYRHEALHIGAAGYVLKSSAREQLTRAVRDSLSVLVTT